MVWGLFAPLANSVRRLGEGGAARRCGGSAFRFQNSDLQIARGGLVAARRRC
jgi:hypothetical protein